MNVIAPYPLTMDYAYGVFLYLATSYVLGRCVLKGMNAICRWLD